MQYNPRNFKEKLSVPRTHQFSLTLMNSEVYSSDLLSVQELTSIVSKHNTKIDNHLQIMKYTL